MKLIEIIEEIYQEALLSDNKIIVIYGKHNYGKSTFMKRIYESLDDKPKIFQSGCNPIYRKIARENLVDKIEFAYKQSKEQCTLVVDELDDTETILKILEHMELLRKVYICTNTEECLKILHMGHIIDLEDKYSYAEDYRQENNVSPGRYLGGDRMTNEEESVCEKKRVIHSLMITINREYKEISTIFYKKE